MLTVLAVGSAVPSFAQPNDAQKEKEALYAKYINNYDKDIEKRKIAVQAGKDYLQKFGGGDESADPLIAYFKENVPVIEKTIKEATDQAAADKIEADRLKAEAAAAETRFNNFNKGIVGKNWQQAFSSGKEILDNNPKLLDVYIVLGTIGYDRAVEKNAPNGTNVTTYNDQAIDYAKKAIQLIKNGEESKSYGTFYGENGKDGYYQYNDKENALGWLNYNIGYILNYNEKKPKEALPYLYEATKHESIPQKSSDVYRIIGEYYFNQVAELEGQRQGIRTSLGNKDNEKTLELFAMQKGYADRGMDAYARAYNIENANTQAVAGVKQGLYDRFKKLYTFRNNGKDDGADAYLPTVKAKPLPNPATPVQPIIDEADKEIQVTDETKPATDNDKMMMTTDKPMTKPATTDKTKPATTPAKPSNSTPTKPMSSTMKKTAPKPTKS